MKTFSNRTAIVTGAASGIGLELARQLAAKGATVILTDINGEGAEKEAQAIAREFKVNTRAYQVDHGKLESVSEFRENFCKGFKTADVLCLNAGIGHSGLIQEIDLETWQKVININIWGAIYMINLFVDDLISTGGGHILITASGLGLMGMPGLSAYCTSKFAMVGLAESLRAELKLHNIVVSALCPGVINTNIIKAGDVSSSIVSKDKVVDFYERFGASAEQVARDGLHALEKDIGVMVTPANTLLPWGLKRLSPELYDGLNNLVFSQLKKP